jgi:hypothetical protein
MSKIPIWIRTFESILLSPLQIPSESGMAITPHPLIGFALEYMHWKALLRDFPLDGVLSTTTCDTPYIHFGDNKAPLDWMISNPTVLCFSWELSQASCLPGFQTVFQTLLLVVTDMGLLTQI